MVYLRTQCVTFCTYFVYLTTYHRLHIQVQVVTSILYTAAKSANIKEV